MNTVKTTKVSKSDTLPLTCSRKGTCCHGNQVWLNPWELQLLAHTKKFSISEFITDYTEFGGIRLRFDGKINTYGKKSCRLYSDEIGCRVYSGRPLACRMFPLGRQIQFGETHYIYQGDAFPCLKECPEVQTLPPLSVGEYLIGQETNNHEIVQAGYLEIVQNIADSAFTLLLDTSLAASGDRTTLKEWRKIGKENPEALLSTIELGWLNALIQPPLDTNINPSVFIEQHNEYLQQKIQDNFGHLKTNEEFRKAAILLMRMALYLALSIGADITELSEHWIAIAKENGALE